MSEKSENAFMHFSGGYNCAQSVICAFDEIENKELMIKIASSFGGGVGGMRQVCGAVSGMVIIAGASKGYSTPEVGSVKNAQTLLINDMCKDFIKETGSIVCGELLGIEAFTSCENKYSCQNLVRIATEITEKYMK